MGRAFCHIPHAGVSNLELLHVIDSQPFKDWPGTSTSFCGRTAAIVGSVTNTLSAVLLCGYDTDKRLRMNGVFTDLVAGTRLDLLHMLSSL